MKKQFNKARHEATPSRAFKSVLLKQLRSEMSQWSMPNSTLFARYGAIGVTSLVLVLGVGTGVYAYESPKVIEGHPLNMVKQQIENMEERMADLQGRPVQFHAKMTERRLNELELHKDQKEQADRLLAVVAQELGITIEQLQQGLHNEETRKELVNQLTNSNPVIGGLIERFINRMQEHEPEEGMRKQWMEHVGLGEEVSAIREELKNSDLNNEEKHEIFREKMKALLDEQKDQIEARRDALKAQGTNDEEVRVKLREEFGVPARGPMDGSGRGRGMQIEDEDVEGEEVEDEDVNEDEDQDQQNDEKDDDLNQDKDEGERS